MAWQEISWSCGHETRKQLYGPHKDRERFVEWAERQGSCPDCYRGAKREEDRAAGPGFVVRETAHGVEFVCWRESYPLREALKERGYCFGEVYGPHSGDLTAVLRGPGPGWALVTAVDEQVEEEVAWIVHSGYELEIQGKVSRLLATAIEGRPDLIHAPNAYLDTLVAESEGENR